MTYLLRVAAATHPSLRDAPNEDHALAWARPNRAGRPRGLLVIADGMGGHEAGEVASRLAVTAVHDALRPFIERPDRADTSPLFPGGVEFDEAPPQLADRLRAAVHAANRAIYEYAHRNHIEAGNLGSTITCVLIAGPWATIANVGDCRTYHLARGRLHQITEDHSYVGHMVRSGRLPPEALASDPRRHLLTRSLGQSTDVDVDLWTQRLATGDRLLLCSDGFWQAIGDQQRLLRSLELPPATAVHALVELAREWGADDDISVAIVEYTQA